MFKLVSLISRILFCLIPMMFSFGQAKDQILIPRIKGIITLDGLSSESTWIEIKPITLIQHTPNFGKEPTEKTELLLGYDDNNLYVAGRLYDSDPSKILATSLKRDSDSPANDWFGIIIDTFNDKENAVGFFTTPSGLRWDGTTSNDAQGNNPIETSWNTFWDVAVVQNESGWFVEMQIPFSSLRFQKNKEKIIMGIISWRFIARKGERDIFPSIPPNWEYFSFWKPSQAQEVVLEGIQPHTPFYITPYLLGGGGNSYGLSVPKTNYINTNNSKYEGGLDLKYGLTSNLTLDATLNTDFAQVEADDQQINLTRFSLFFPEKRTFFLERASTFDFNFDDQNRLFHSRRIGIYNDKPVRIYGGARIVGRIEEWDVGFLNMQTELVNDIPSENFGILRLRKQMFNPYSYAGGIVTSRLGTDGSYNTAYGLDGIFRLLGDEYLTVKWAQTFENNNGNKLFSLSPSRIQINWERRIFDGFNYIFDYSRSGENYNPGIGFELRNNYSKYNSRLQYGWTYSEESSFLRTQIFFDSKIITRNSDGSTESSELGPGIIFTTRSFFYGELYIKRFFERVPETFQLSDQVEVPQGEYTFYDIETWFSTSRRLPLSGHIAFEAGSFYDGEKYSVGAGSIWRASSNLDLNGSIVFNKIIFNKRNQKLEGGIVKLRTTLMLDVKFSTAVFIQYNNITNVITLNARLRFNPVEGTDFYLVYNEVLNTNRTSVIPNLPFSSSRALLLKMNYTFNI